ncbi:unnamed protein product [Prunus brigantina]
MSTRMSELFVIGIGILVCLLLQCEAYYTVGDAKGWRADPSITNWPKNKSFKAGDVLCKILFFPCIFKFQVYSLQITVALTNSDAYNNCDIALDILRIRKRSCGITARHNLLRRCN